MVGRGAFLDGRLFFSAGPMVRIRFPPAKSLQTFCSAWRLQGENAGPPTRTSRDDPSGVGSGQITLKRDSGYDVSTRDLLQEIAAATSSGASDRISDWFTEDFRLHEPGKPALPVGREGARQMREAGPQIRAGLKTPIKVEILDMIEEDDRVAVRWQLTATEYDGKPYERSIMTIYRFENGRIAEDCGISTPAVWP